MQTLRANNVWDAFIPVDCLGRLESIPFLARCRDGSIGKPELEVFLGQHYFYAQNFTRFLCALIGNLPDSGDRRILMENLFEEMGLANGHTISHARMYQEMIGRLGVDPAQIGVLPSTRLVIDLMLDSCRNPDFMVGLGALCLGAEALVPALYSMLMEGFRCVGIDKRDLEYFRVHIDCDDIHAVTIKGIMEREISRDPAKAETAIAAGRRIIEARTAFFRDLSPSPSEPELRVAV